MMEKKRTFGLVAVGAFAATGIGLLVGCAPFILPALRKVCLPYVPATDRQVKNVMKILRKRKGNVIDLGSGDGRIVSYYNFYNRYITLCTSKTILLNFVFYVWTSCYSGLDIARPYIHAFYCNYIFVIASYSSTNLLVFYSYRFWQLQSFVFLLLA